jgi:type III restriction enzyme
MGRALRRMSYEADPDTGLFRTEYADIMGIDGLNFSGQPVNAPLQRPREIVNVHAVTPDRDALEIVFPRVEGYRINFPEERLEADFTGMEPYVLTPEKVGPCEVTMAGILGPEVKLTLDFLKIQRRSTIAMHLAKHLVFEKLRDANAAPKIHLIPRAKAITNRWLSEGHLVCTGGAMEAQILYGQLADEACDLILGALVDPTRPEPLHRAVLDPYIPEGSTIDVNFNTSKPDRWRPRPDRSHVNWIVLDSDWEANLADRIENHPRVLAYAKNHNLGFEVPYLREGEPHRYRPDFLVRLDTPEPTTLVLEVKGFRGHDAMLNAETMRTRWIPAVNRLGTFGRWGFAELREVHDFGPALDAAIKALLDERETA